MASLSRTALARSALRLPSSSSAAVASSSRLPTYSSAIHTRSNTTSCSSSEAARTVQHGYFVPRVGKTRSSLPVYTDVRNGGTRVMTEVRNIQGSVSALRHDLSIFLAETYSSSDPTLTNDDSPLKVNKKPLTPRAGRKLVPKTANPCYLDPIQPAKVAQAGKLKIRGNRVQHVKAFLQSRGF